MTNIFQTIGGVKPNHTAFDFGHEVKLSCHAGDLVPIFFEECVPGDTIINTTEIFARLAPQLYPVMHRLNLFTHFFAIPKRLLWDDYDDHVTGCHNGKLLETPPVFPTINLADIDPKFTAKGSLADYLGFPVRDMSTNEYKISSLPFLAYQMIYNEWYRDQNLIDEIAYTTVSGAKTVSEAERIMTLRRRCWEKDYFTSALPFAQKGDEVTIPLGDTADIKYRAINKQQLIVHPGGGQITAGSETVVTDNSIGNAHLKKVTSGESVNIDPNGTLFADLTSATAATINSLRNAFQVQRFLERLARGGSRYTEYIYSMYGVKSPDSRLQRPEYIGGGFQPIVFSEVLQTSQSNLTPQGTMAGHGVSAGNQHSFRYSVPEPCYIMGIMSIMPRTAYQQGVPRYFRRLHRFDEYLPSFAHLGEQEVRYDEIYLSVDSDTAGDNADTFGYQSRYAEYRSKFDRVAGDMRDSLSSMHCGRIFSAKPELNEDFVKFDWDKRIFAVTDPNVHEFWCQIYHNETAIRPMPFEADPGLIDHF